jgi:uncharacterized protein GlcG (DUF336 family)
VLAVALAALGVIGLQVAFNWWLARRSFKAIDQIPELKERNIELRIAVKERDGHIDTLQRERDSQIAARKQAEEAARHAINELAKNGNAPAIVSALNERLQALSRLSNVSDATSEGDSAEGTVHGAVPSGDGPEDTRPG